jgi:hypothetical protein
MDHFNSFQIDDENDSSANDDSVDPPKRFVRIVKKSSRDVVNKFLKQLMDGNTEEMKKKLNGMETQNRESGENNYF